VKSNPALKIGIVGAGAAGLCTAMILQKLGRAFEILEARPRDPGQPAPVGGRMFTHYFDQSVPPQQYDYFDVGAMRFPYIPGMYPTFDLIDWVGLTSMVIPYYFASPTGGTVHYYNDQRGVDPPFVNDLFKVGIKNGGTVPDELAVQDAGSFLESVFQPFATQVAQSPTFEDAWTSSQPVSISLLWHQSILSPLREINPQSHG
jgi:protoporphyrinogen oxidase